jgi:hypothetical protein
MNKKNDIAGATLLLAIFLFTALMLATITGVLVLDKDLGGKAKSKEAVTAIVDNEETTLYFVTVKPGGGGMSKAYETSKVVFHTVELGHWYEFELSGFPRNYIEGFSE